jgi:hypothetical protein
MCLAFDWSTSETRAAAKKRTKRSGNNKQNNCSSFSKTSGKEMCIRKSKVSLSFKRTIFLEVKGNIYTSVCKKGLGYSQKKGLGKGMYRERKGQRKY